jgi:phage-related protein
MYVTKLDDVVYVLHAFQKKTQQTARRDLDLAVQRWKQVQAQELASVESDLRQCVGRAGKIRRKRLRT